jgi:hypothetical protein
MEHAHWQLVLFANQVTLALPQQLVSDKILVLLELTQIKHLISQLLLIVLSVQINICVLKRQMFFIIQ